MNGSTIVVALAAHAGLLYGQTCDTSVTRTSLSVPRPTVVRLVSVRTDAPISLPVGGGWLSALRRTTETSIIQRQLLFYPGQQLDTLAFAETLRRLRAQRLYADIVVRATQCAGSDSIDLAVVTRDAWTLRPIGRVVPPATVSLGVEDRNLLGSGRTIVATNDQTPVGHGGSVSFTDPWLFGTNVIAGGRFADVAGTHTVRAFARHHEISSFDPWRVEGSLLRQTFSDRRTPEHPLRTLSISFDAGRVVGDARTSITVPYLGVEMDSALVLSIRQGDAGVPTPHRRHFIGADIGLFQQAVQYDTLSWFVPQRGFLDIPVGLEGDALIAPGFDRAQHASAAHFDAWLGRMWMPVRGSLVIADAWSSGYLGDVRTNQIDRIAIAAYREASGGYFGGRAMFEQLLQLDPDQRVLSLATIANDPSLGAVPQAFRQADRAIVASMERSVHLRAIARASVIDAAAFVAGSSRWDAPTMGSGRFAVAVIGARLRVLSANGAISSTRVDVSYPVLASGSVVRRPLVSVSIAPLFDTSRQRDGQRRQQ